MTAPGTDSPEKIRITPFWVAVVLGALVIGIGGIVGAFASTASDQNNEKASRSRRRTT